MKRGAILKRIKDLERAIATKFLFFGKDSEENETFPQLSPTQMRILKYIMEKNNEPVYQKELEDVLKIKRATVSGVLQTMERNGLIERIIDNEDTRTKKIILKKETIQIFEIGKEKMEALEKDMIKNISEEELQVFLNVLDKMEENIK